MNVLITAGPTREALDPVRYLTNRSSGRMGYALAQAAAEAGHTVKLVSGPVTLLPPDDVDTISVESAAQMADAVKMALSWADAAIFAAAVADYRPVAVATEKIKKSADRLVLELEKTTDILGSARQPWGYAGVLVGFAAETTDVLAHATEKLRRKGCDMLVANDVSQPGIGFDSADNEAVLLFPDRPPQPLPRGAKIAVAREILAAVETIAAARRGGMPA